MKIPEALTNRWSKLSPAQRATIGLGGLMTVLTVASQPFVATMEGTRQAGQPRIKERSSVNLTMPTRNDMTVEGLLATINNTNATVKKLEDQLRQADDRQAKLLKAMEEKPAQSGEAAIVADMAKELKGLRDEVSDLRAGKTAPSSSPTPGLDASLGSPQEGAAPSPEVSRKLVVRFDEKAAAAAQVKPAPVAKPVAYLPPGATFEGVLLNGMDAPTSSVTRKNPVPAVIRVKSEAVLPNYSQYDIRECFVIVSGFGVMATERAEMRTEVLSCVKDNGEVVDTKLEGFVVGEDGKVGVRGRLVSKQGALIAKSLVSGVFSGIGKATAPTQVPQLNIAPGMHTQTQSTSLETAMSTGLASGVSQSANDASKLFLEMAKDAFPVVEIDAMRRVTITLVKGVELVSKGRR